MKVFPCPWRFLSPFFEPPSIKPSWDGDQYCTQYSRWDNTIELNKGILKLSILLSIPFLVQPYILLAFLITVEHWAGNLTELSSISPQVSFLSWWFVLCFELLIWIKTQTETVRATEFHLLLFWNPKSSQVHATGLWTVWQTCAEVWVCNKTRQVLCIVFDFTTKPVYSFS